MLVAVGAIDNLGKGAASQAVQCANAVLGLPETRGLEPISVPVVMRTVRATLQPHSRNRKKPL